MDSIFSRLRQVDLRGLVLPIAFVALWYAVTALGWVNTKLIVPPGNVVKVAYEYVVGTDFFVAIGWSLLRNLSGFAIGAGAAIAFGIVLGVSRWIEGFFGPTFHTLKQISVFAWLPLISAWLGTGNDSKILFVALTVFYPVALYTIEGVQSVTREQLELAKVYRLRSYQVLTKLIFPAASPQIIAGLQLGLIYGWLATIGSEFLLFKSGPGIGDVVIRGRAAFNVELIVFGLVTIGLIGTALNRVATRLEARALRWRNQRA
jgi:sulfonate transport system permease protein